LQILHSVQDDKNRTIYETIMLVILNSFQDLTQ
jgi:hypothetical protein